jgi:hypothetical protein
MNLYKVLILLGAFLQVAYGSETHVSQARLGMVYSNLINASLSITGQAVEDRGDLEKKAASMAYPALQKDCMATVTQIQEQMVSVSTPTSLSESYAYVKAAFQRLLYDREQPHKKLLKWAWKHPKKLKAEITDLCQSIHEALPSLAP